MSGTDLPRREALRWSIKAIAGLSVFVAASSELGSKASAAGRHSDPDYCPPVCYLQGTKVETRRGPMTIEDLQIGDEIITHRGEPAEIKWIGRMSFAKGAAWDHRSKPVLFKRSSIADNVPSSDLYVSQQHAMLVGDVFIPAKYLVNGSSIKIVTPATDEIHYLQIELEGHEAIFANGAPSESFFATSARETFANYPEYLRLYDAAPVDHMTPYKPIHRFSTLGSKIGAVAGALAQAIGFHVSNPVLRARADLKLRALRLDAGADVATRRILLHAVATSRSGR